MSLFKKLKKRINNFYRNKKREEFFIPKNPGTY